MKKLHIIEFFIFIFLILILAFLGIKIFKQTFDIGTTYHATFKDIDSIVIGSPVRILGVDVGHVTKIQSDTDEIHVSFVIKNNNIKIPNGTKASIEFFGIAGSRSIELTPPDKNTEEIGLVISEPIRIGDAFDIMQNFFEASMKTLSGLSEFARSRSEKDVEQLTTSILVKTQETDDKIINLTSKIEKGSHNLHKSFEGTTKGFTRFYNEAEALNISNNFNIGKYTVNLTKRTLIHLHRNIKSFHSQIGNYNKFVDFSAKKIEHIKDIYHQIDELHDAFGDLNTSMETLNKNFSQENIDSFFDKLNNVKTLSENLKNEI